MDKIWKYLVFPVLLMGSGVWGATVEPVLPVAARL